MMNMRRALERNTREVHAEFFRDAQVHLVIHQPQRHLRNLDGEFFDLDAIELIDVDLDLLVDVEKARAGSLVYGAQHFEFQRAQFAVGDDQKIAAAAGRVEEGERAQLFVELE